MVGRILWDENHAIIDKIQADVSENSLRPDAWGSHSEEKTSLEVRNILAGS